MTANATSYSGTAVGDSESVDSFRTRARAWIDANLVHRSDVADDGTDDNLSATIDDWHAARALQRTLHGGGFAGICYPREYGGLGLTPAHQRAFNEEVADHQMPMLMNIPTLTICGPTILDMGNEEQKREHLSAALRGDEVFVQF